MGLQILLLIVGFILLIKGADWLVKGASSLARKYNISELVIGMTIVAFGTSAPELVVNTFASFNGNTDIVYGNIIGSNNFNLFFILGISGLIFPLKVHSSTVYKEIPLSLLAAVLLLLFSNDFLFRNELHFLSRIDSFILLLFFAGFLYYMFLQLRKDKDNTKSSEQKYSALRISLMIILGLAGLVAGGKITVNSAVEIARFFNISEKIIGLTIIAVGTSLPELATSVVATLRKNNDIAVGNVIGSNIFNIFFIMGLSGLIRPIPFTVSFNTDMYVLIGGTIFLLLAMYTGKQHKLDRWEAGLMFLAYIAYTVYLL